MPEELTPKQRDELVGALQALTDELVTLVQSLSEGAKAVDLDQPIGRLSRMDAMQQQQMSAANKRKTELRQRLVAQALVTAAEGDYGSCRQCEEPIGYPRLRARPEAALCLSCQSAHEDR